MDEMRIGSMKKKSLLGKLLLQLLLPGFLTVAAAVSAILITTNNSLSSLNTQRVLAQTETAANQVDQFFTRNIEIVRQMEANTQFSTIFKQASPGKEFKNTAIFSDCLDTLENIQASNSGAIEIAWLGDMDESQYLFSDGSVSGLDSWILTERPWFAPANGATDVVITPPYLSTTGSIVVSVISSVKDITTGETLGFVATDITTDQLNASMSTISTSDTGYMMIITSEDVIIYHPNAEYIGKTTAEAGLDAFTGIAVAAQEQVIDVGGEKLHVFPQTVASAGWSVVSCIPQTEFRAPVRTTFVTCACVGLAIAVVLAGLVVYVAKRTTGPLKNLAAAANDIANGKFSASIELKTLDETGQVAFALKKTIDRLREYVDYINEITRVLDEMADGKLKIELYHDYKGDFSKIKDALMNLSGKLSSSISSIEASASQVALGAEQIAGGAQALSSGTTQQASAIEELSSTIDDISQKVSDTAENANEANDKTAHAVAEIANSNGKMDALTQAMNEINTSSNEIGKIIKAIEDIAFQTNILALNAAVEAARAGEAGKGFAVVADEVRNLASKSAEAAKNTTTLIQSSMQAVAKGTTLTREAAASLAVVVESARSIEEITGMISLATKDQASAISQVVMGIQQISDVVQTNSATSEESAASSEELSSQAALLKNLVQEFEL